MNSTFNNAEPIKYAFKVTPEFSFATESLLFTTEIGSFKKEIHRQIVCFKDETVRKCLIELGWTPPTKKTGS